MIKSKFNIQKGKQSMKFQRNYCPSISQILSDESLKRLSAITAYLNLYSTGDNTSNANFRLSSSLESMKRIIISSEIETLHRKTVKEDKIGRAHV